MKCTHEESEHLWIMPFFDQWTDSCRDLYDDMNAKSATALTHYTSCISRQEALDKNLLGLFHASLYLCKDLYLSSGRNIQTGAFLDRPIICTLGSMETDSGESALHDILYLFY